jgi:acyl-ACP thioesterase
MTAYNTCDKLQRSGCMSRSVFIERMSMMENFLEKQYSVTSSLCDAQGLLGIRNIFDIYMDMAAENAAQQRLGLYDMRDKGCYWVAVRTRVRLYKRPAMGESFTAMTWPGKPSLAKSDRFYRLTQGQLLLAEGRTEWAAQDMETGRIRRTDSYDYPTELVHREETVCSEPFLRFHDLPLTENTLVKAYTVCSMDIDLGQHMNNVAYIRMLLGTFTVAELAALDVQEVEISYRRGCFEGEQLSIYRTKEDNTWRFQVQKPNGETAVHAHMILRS